ncbi:hypothetical protein ACJ41O_012840 [Fusarium nematophilum]
MGFHETAQDITLEDGHILKAQLQNEDGEYVDAEIDLNSFIGNSDGSFEWGGESRALILPIHDFADSAEDISFDLEGDDSTPILRATLGNLEGEGVESDINLSEHIQNENGEFQYTG